jgi:hypothetical protein
MRSIYRMIRSAPSSHLLDHTATLRRDHREEPPPLTTFVRRQENRSSTRRLWACLADQPPWNRRPGGRRLSSGTWAQPLARFGVYMARSRRCLSTWVDQVEIPLALPSASSRQGRPPPMTDRLAAPGPARVVGSVGRWGPEAQGGNFAPHARRNRQQGCLGAAPWEHGWLYWMLGWASAVPGGGPTALLGPVPPGCAAAVSGGEGFRRAPSAHHSRPSCSQFAHRRCAYTRTSQHTSVGNM